MLKEIEDKYINITKKLVWELREKGFNVNSIKVTIDGNESRDNYTVKTEHNL